MALKSPLSFLRPLALPRSSTVHSFFKGCRALTTTSTLHTQSTTASASIKSPRPIPLTSFKPANPTPSIESSEKPASGVLPTTNLPYRVLRTGTNGLPVYLLKKRGGNLHLTRIRKIEGDKQAMVKDLTVALALDKPVPSKASSRKAKSDAESPAKRIWINPVTGHIYVKGHHHAEVNKFLTDRSF